jgi:hypothetical protein
VAENYFSKSVSHIPRWEEWVVKMLVIDYVHHISSCRTYNHKSHHMHTNYTQLKSWQIWYSVVSQHTSK